MTAMPPDEFLELREALAGPLQDSLQGERIGRVERLCPPKPVADDMTKLLVRNRNADAVAVIHHAATATPQMAARGVERARWAGDALGPQLRRVILKPLCEGWSTGAATPPIAIVGL
jgi:hypothetical protein